MPIHIRKDVEMNRFKKAYCDCCKIERTHEMEKKYSKVYVRRFLYNKIGELVEVAETYYTDCTKRQAIAAFNRRKILLDKGYGPALFVRAED